MFSLIKHLRPLISTSIRPAFFKISYCFMFLMFSIISSDQPVSSLIFAFSSSVKPSVLVSVVSDRFPLSAFVCSVALREHCSIRAEREVRSIKEIYGGSTSGFSPVSISSGNSFISGNSSAVFGKLVFSNCFCKRDSTPVIKQTDLLSTFFLFHQRYCQKRQYSIHAPCRECLCCSSLNALQELQHLI